MQKLVYVLFYACISSVMFGQTIPENKPQIKALDTLSIKNQDSTTLDTKIKKSKKSLQDRLGSEKSKDNKPKIQDYLIISSERDTTFVDTSITLKKEYKFNYLRKDNFGLIPFSNLGQTYNSLTYNFESTYSMPQFGHRSLIST